VALISITEHMATSPRHSTFYLAAGPQSGPPIIFVHGWPELAISWRHQLPAMASLGFRAIAPDMRGYGRSTVHRAHADYAQEHIVADMLHLLDSLGTGKAVWVGHDWGSPVVWNLAMHHPDRCVAIVNLCVPYGLERGVDYVLPFVDRTVYPADKFPAGQWEYMRFYEENFDKACRTFDANPYNTMKALFRKGSPAGRGKPSRTALVRKDGGWFGGADAAPDVPRDGDVVSEEDLCAYVSAIQRNGFFGPDSWYMNHTANAAYAARAPNGGRIDLPVLFLAARYDYTCECVDSSLAEPMRQHCRDLTEQVIDTGHWMAQEKPAEVNAALTHWLATKVPGFWPR
jgi:soluble epoxide hydrolase / lipid-phosphate phosphatase